MTVQGGNPAPVEDVAEHERGSSSDVSRLSEASNQHQCERKHPSDQGSSSLLSTSTPRHHGNDESTDGRLGGSHTVTQPIAIAKPRASEKYDADQQTPLSSSAPLSRGSPSGAESPSSRQAGKPKRGLLKAVLHAVKKVFQEGGSSSGGISDKSRRSAPGGLAVAEPDLDFSKESSAMDLASASPIRSPLGSSHEIRTAASDSCPRFSSAAHTPPSRDPPTVRSASVSTSASRPPVQASSSQRGWFRRLSLDRHQPGEQDADDARRVGSGDAPASHYASAPADDNPQLLLAQPPHAAGVTAASARRHSLVLPTSGSVAASPSSAHSSSTRGGTSALSRRSQPSCPTSPSPQGSSANGPLSPTAAATSLPRSPPAAVPSPGGGGGGFKIGGFMRRTCASPTLGTSPRQPGRLSSLTLDLPLANSHIGQIETVIASYIESTRAGDGEPWLAEGGAGAPPAAAGSMLGHAQPGSARSRASQGSNNSPLPSPPASAIPSSARNARHHLASSPHSGPVMAPWSSGLQKSGDQPLPEHGGRKPGNQQHADADEDPRPGSGGFESGSPLSPKGLVTLSRSLLHPRKSPATHQQQQHTEARGSGSAPEGLDRQGNPAASAPGSAGGSRSATPSTSHRRSSAGAVIGHIFHSLVGGSGASGGSVRRASSTATVVPPEALMLGTEPASSGLPHSGPLQHQHGHMYPSPPQGQGFTFDMPSSPSGGSPGGSSPSGSGRTVSGRPQPPHRLSSGASLTGSNSFQRATSGSGSGSQPPRGEHSTSASGLGLQNPPHASGEAPVRRTQSDAASQLTQGVAAQHGGPHAPGPLLQVAAAPGSSGMPHSHSHGLFRSTRGTSTAPLPILEHTESLDPELLERQVAQQQLGAALVTMNVRSPTQQTAAVCVGSPRFGPGSVGVTHRAGLDSPLATTSPSTSGPVPMQLPSSPSQSLMPQLQQRLQQHQQQQLQHQGGSGNLQSPSTPCSSASAAGPAPGSIAAAAASGGRTTSGPLRSDSGPQMQQLPSSFGVRRSSADFGESAAGGAAGGSTAGAVLSKGGSGTRTELAASISPQLSATQAQLLQLQGQLYSAYSIGTQSSHSIAPPGTPSRMRSGSMDGRTSRTSAGSSTYSAATNVQWPPGDDPSWHSGSVNNPGSAGGPGPGDIRTSSFPRDGPVAGAAAAALLPSGTMLAAAALEASADPQQQLMLPSLSAGPPPGLTINVNNLASSSGIAVLQAGVSSPVACRPRVAGIYNSRSVCEPIFERVSGSGSYDGPVSFEDPPAHGRPGTPPVWVRVGLKAPEVLRAVQDRWCLGGLEIVKELSSNSKAKKYKARCRLSHMTVCAHVFSLQAMAADEREQVLREVEVHAGLDHPNIVDFYAAWQEGQQVVVLDEFMAGGDGTELLKAYGGRIPEQVAVQQVLHPLLLALHHLHSGGVMHRNLRLDNVLFERTPMLLLPPGSPAHARVGNASWTAPVPTKIGGFSLAVDLKSERADRCVGDPKYAAPEVRAIRDSAPDEQGLAPLDQGAPDTPRGLPAALPRSQSKGEGQGQGGSSKGGSHLAPASPGASSGGGAAGGSGGGGGGALSSSLRSVSGVGSWAGRALSLLTTAGKDSGAGVRGGTAHSGGGAVSAGGAPPAATGGGSGGSGATLSGPRPCYYTSADAWSVGIIALELLCGQKVAVGPKGEPLQRRPDVSSFGLCDGARDFLDRALQPDSSARYNALQLLYHPWIKMLQPQHQASSPKRLSPPDC